MRNKNQERSLLGFFSWFSLIRLPNIVLLISAQYLASIYIFSPEVFWLDIIKDPKLFVLVFASVSSVISGYIINDFYDHNKDIINKPLKSRIGNLIDRHSKFVVYFLLNSLAIILASYVSFMAVFFFVNYIFFIWIYSYFLKRILILGNISSAVLAIIPFFAIFLYYKNFETLIFLHAFFLFLLTLLKEFIKDLENISGDYVGDYRTIPVVFGEGRAKIIIIINSILIALSGVVIAEWFDVGLMRFYFYFCGISLIAMIPLLMRSKKKIHYLIFHNILRFIIVMGVASILLIDLQKVIKI